jgi:hypothetical protein
MPIPPALLMVLGPVGGVATVALILVIFLFGVTNVIGYLIDGIF